MVKISDLHSEEESSILSRATKNRKHKCDMHLTVNQEIVGSNPTRFTKESWQSGLLHLIANQETVNWRVQRFESFTLRMCINCGDFLDLCFMCGDPNGGPYAKAKKFYIDDPLCEHMQEKYGGPIATWEMLDKE